MLNISVTSRRLDTNGTPGGVWTWEDLMNSPVWWYTTGRTAVAVCNKFTFVKKKNPTKPPKLVCTILLYHRYLYTFRAITGIHHIISYRIISYRIRYRVISYIIWYHISHDMIWYITSHHIPSYVISYHIMHFINWPFKHNYHSMCSYGSHVTLPYFQNRDYMTSLLALQINTQPPFLTTRTSPQLCQFSRCAITTQVRLNLICWWTAHNPLRPASWSSQYQMYRMLNWAWQRSSCWVCNQGYVRLQQL